MRPRQRLLNKINEGITFLTEQEKRLQPAIDYFTQSSLETMTQISPEKKFELLIQLMKVKTDGLLLLTKMKEILEYNEL